MNLRLITCDIVGCNARHEEKTPGEGFPMWGQIHGIVLNGVPNPQLCPTHLSKLAEIADQLGVLNGMD